MKRWQPVAIGVVLAALGGYFYLHHGLPALGAPSASSDSAAETSASGQPAHIAWESVNRPDGGFRMMMPAGPKDLQIPAYNEAGSTEPVEMLYSNPDGDTTFAVTWENNPPVARVNNRDPEKTLDAARDGMLARTQTTLVNETRLRAAGFPARDIVAKNSGGGLLDARLIYTGQRLYTLIAVFPSTTARREQDVRHFFDSFAQSNTPSQTMPEAPAKPE